VNEDLKIGEADYFLQQLRAAASNPLVTRYQTSAFLSAARTVLQYALEEAKTKPGGQAWYDSSVVAVPVVKFLKDRRDINIHNRPVPIRTDTTIGVGSAALTLSSTGPTVVVERGRDQTITWAVPPPQLPPLPAIDAPPTTSHRYQFKDWPGPEDVLTLCTMYLDEIRKIVSEGRRRGFLTP
jgi:hypothetical protein